MTNTKTLLLGAGMLLCSLIQVASIAHAQDTATITGRVISAESNARIADARVSVSPQLQGYTNKNGVYRISNVPAGNYTIAVSYVGYQTVLDSISVQGSSVVQKDFALRWSDGENLAFAELDPFVVEARIEPDIRALNRQKSADNIKSVVSSDAIGAFPDQIVSDALGRLSGVAVQKQRGEGRDIIIRGLDQSLSTVSLDGVALASNRDDGRSVAMDIYTLDQLAMIEVSKSITPDQIGDSIGGHINLITKDPLDYSGRYMSAHVGIRYSENAEDYMPEGSFSFYDRVGNPEKPLGVGLTLSYQERSTVAERLRAGWDDINDIDLDGDGIPEFAEDQFLIVEDVRNRFNITDRERLGLSLTLSQQVTESTLLRFKAHYNNQVEELSGNRKRWRFRANRTSRLDTSFPVVADGENIIQATNQPSRGRLENAVNPLDLDDTSFTLLLEGVTEGRDWNLDYALSYQDNEEEVEHWFGSFRASNVQMTLGGTSLQPIITATDPSFDPNDPSNYLLMQNDRVNQVIGGQDLVFRTDFSKSVMMSDTPVEWKTGVYLSFKDGRQDFDRRSTNFGAGNSTADGEIFTMANPNVVTFMGPTDFHGVYDVGILFDDRAWARFSNENVELFSHNVERSIDQSRERDWSLEEDVYAAYAMADADFGKLTAVGGVRYEYTDATGSGFERLEDTGEWRLATGGKTYGNLLPSGHLKYEINDNTYLRASYHKSIKRPRATDFAPRRVVVFDELEDEYTISGASPDIEALEADNFDLALEKYTQDAGVFYIAAFYKKIDGFIFTRTIDGTYEGKNATYRVTQNAGDGEVYGLELNAEQNLVFLPEPFNGLGVGANVTLTDSSLEDPQNPDAERPFFKQSDANYNVYVEYGINKVTGRLSYQYRDPFLQSVSSDPRFDGYFGDSESLDFKLSVGLSDSLTMEFTASNLSDDPEDEYTNDGEPFTRLDQSVLTGKFYYLGFRWRN